MKTITRRDAIKRGGQAAAAVAILPVAIPITAALAQDDAELLALHETWRRLEDKFIEATKRAGKLFFSVRGKYRRQPHAHSVMQQLEDCSRLEDYSSPEWRAFKNHPDGFNGGFQAAFDVALKRWNEGLDRAKARAGVPALEKKAEMAGARSDAAATRFYDTPARTTAGIALKLEATWPEKWARSQIRRGETMETPATIEA